MKIVKEKKYVKISKEKKNTVKIMYKFCLL